MKKYGLHKQAQLTVFVIVGMVVVLSIAILLYSKSSIPSKQLDTGLTRQSNFQSDVNIFKKYVESCLIQQTEKVGDLLSVLIQQQRELSDTLPAQIANVLSDQSLSPTKLSGLSKDSGETE